VVSALSRTVIARLKPDIAYEITVRLKPDTPREIAVRL